MHPAGPAAILNPMTWSARGGEWGHRGRGTVMAGANGSDARTAVAVIGTGIMGSAITRNLVAAGLSTRVWDQSPSATRPLADAGALVAASARDAVQDADVVITMLPTADVVESVIFDGGVAGAFTDGCVWVQMGTIGVEATLRVKDRLAASRPGVMFVDAPVSGSKGPAEQGELLILAAGPAAAADAVEPVFDVIGRKTVWLGEAGKGSQMKLVVNAYMSSSSRVWRKPWSLPIASVSVTSNSRRPSRAGRLTRRSPAPSSTRWTGATSQPSSRSSGR
jgi:hypothetical protein